MANKSVYISEIHMQDERKEKYFKYAWNMFINKVGLIMFALKVLFKIQKQLYKAILLKSLFDMGVLL